MMRSEIHFDRGAFFDRQLHHTGGNRQILQANAGAIKQGDF